MKTLLSVLLTAALVWQNETPKPNQAPSEEPRGAARRLQVMKEAVAAYTLFPNKDRKTKLTLVTEPQLRWSNPVSGITDGSFFVWCLKSDPMSRAPSTGTMARLASRTAASRCGIENSSCHRAIAMRGFPERSTPH